MCYLVCEMVHIKKTFLLIGESSPCGGSGFPLSLSEWSFTICPTPYNRGENVLSASFPSFLPLRSIATKDIFYLMTRSPHLRILGDGHIVKDSSDSKKENPLPIHHGLLFPITSKGSFTCTTPQTVQYIPRPLLH